MHTQHRARERGIHKQEEEQTLRESYTHTGRVTHTHRRGSRDSRGSVNDEAKSKSKTKFKMSPHRLEQLWGRRGKWGREHRDKQKGTKQTWRFPWRATPLKSD